MRPLAWARAVAATLVTAALVAALPSAASSEHDALRSWRVELPGRIAGIAEHCGDDACVLFLLAAPVEGDGVEGHGPVESESHAPGGGSEEGLSLHRLLLDGDGARLTTIAKLLGTARSKRVLGNSEQVSVQVGLGGGTVTRPSGATSGGIIINLFKADAPGREPVAVLQVGESVHVLSFGLSFGEADAPLGRPVLELDPGLHLRALAPGSPWLVAEEAGRLELIELEPSSATGLASDSGSGRPSDSGSGRRRIEVVLPLEVGRQQRGLALSSPAVHVLAQDPLTLAIGPQAVGTVRLRTLVFQPLTPAAPLEPNVEVPALERWSRLPEPEAVTGSEILRLGGLDLLLVETTRADGFGIFERKKMRLFELTADRTRSGHPPRAALLSYSRHWQALDWKLTDVTRDGVLDLVLLQPEGLSGEKLAVDLYRGKSDGTFADQKVRSLLPETRGHVRYGDDLDGDGVGDLLVLDVDSLALWRGRKPDRRGLLEESPDWIFRADRDDGSVPVPGENGEHVEHRRESLFVGAGRPELVLFATDQETVTRLEVVRLRF